MKIKKEPQQQQLNLFEAATNAAAGAFVFSRQEALPLVVAVRCERCDEPFEITRARGRPRLFCSDGCREATAREQRRASDRRRAAAKRASKGAGA